jgi:hypothetical protein
MVKVIMQIWRACGVIGMTMQQAWEVIWRLSIGSVPKLRRRSLEVLLREAARRRSGPKNRGCALLLVVLLFATTTTATTITRYQQTC